MLFSMKLLQEAFTDLLSEIMLRSFRKNARFSICLPSPAAIAALLPPFPGRDVYGRPPGAVRHHNPDRRSHNHNGRFPLFFPRWDWAQESPIEAIAYTDARDAQKSLHWIPFPAGVPDE